VLGRLYFARQAASLLKFASETRNPRLAAVLVERAAEIKEKIEEVALQSDASPAPPDVEA
jgi:hypothetical protein